MVSVAILAGRHLKGEEELQRNHYRFLEQNLHQTLWNCRECHLRILLERQPKGGEGFFANASDYEETWNDSDSITAVIARKQFSFNVDTALTSYEVRNQHYNNARKPDTTFLR